MTEDRGGREGETPVTGCTVLIRIPIRNRVATRHVGHSSRPNVDVYDGHLRSGIKRREACALVAAAVQLYGTALVDEKFWDLGG